MLFLLPVNDLKSSKTTNFNHHNKLFTSFELVKYVYLMNFGELVSVW